jgi:hypothetical protein
MATDSPTTPGNYRVSATADNTPRHSVTGLTGNVPVPASTTGITPPAPVTAPPPPIPDVALNAETTLTTAETYLKNLTEQKIDLNTARNIYDTVATKGVYEESIKIRNGVIVFRTRSYDDHLRLVSIVELSKPVTPAAYAEMVNRYNLAASLVSWQGQKFPATDTDDIFEENLKKIRKLPGPVITLLMRELFKFDAKINAVFGDGAVEVF